ncbi:MAG: DNA polymerase III subunit gamma/tau, partial [Vallitaleaceae bacterium]|nr:DNA polymerase III subunit gamma/tau [Vallitaleaceae bacterium]
DAASNNGVDNIREIREEVRYTPTEGKYKVYIIDEVHMLSTGAFNALLKTLEEPPSHVKFILATTEPHKIPATILSRCQRYDFKRISTETIAGRLKYYLEEEEIEAEDKAIRYVAKVADGSMRDGLSILDQCIAFYLGEKITLDKVLDVLGAVDSDVFYQLTDGIIQKDTKGVLDLVEKVVVQGRDLSQFLLDEINYLRNLLLVHSVDEAGQLLDVSSEVFDALRKQSNTVDENHIIHLIKAFSQLDSMIKYMTGKRTLIEIELIKLCKPTLNEDYEAVLSRLTQVEERLEKGIVVTNSGPNPEYSGEAAVTMGAKAAKKKEIDTEAFPEDIKKAIQEYTKLVMSTTGLLKSTLKESLPFYMEDGKLTLVCHNDVQKNILSEEANKSTIIEVLKEIHERVFDVNVVTEKDYTKAREGNMEDIERAIHSIKNKIKFDVTIK